MSSPMISEAPQAFNESSIATFDEGSLTTSHDLSGFENFIQLKINEEKLTPSSSTEVNLRDQWDNLPISTTKTFVKPSVTPKRRKTKSQDQYEDKARTVYTFQPVCNICLTFTPDVPTIRCTGVCLRYFHLKCLRYPPDNRQPRGANFQCVNCWCNHYSCASCGQPSKITALLNCDVPCCGNLYHGDCLGAWGTVWGEDSVPECPSHSCFTCKDRTDATMLICARCPAAFHDNPQCLPDEIVRLSLSHVLCGHHNDLPCLPQPEENFKVEKTKKRGRISRKSLIDKQEDNLKKRGRKSKKSMQVDVEIADLGGGDIQEGEETGGRMTSSELVGKGEDDLQVAVLHESFCFRCFDGGELLLCDKRCCTKSFHLTCIGLTCAPCGSWYCPWHFCDLCGDPSSLFCAQCPSSYCPRHSDDGNMRPLSPASAGSRLGLCLSH